VHWGPIVTKYERRVGVSIVEDEEDEDEDGVAPMIVFSPIMQPSPITMGPS
jgi:hypothetical protein